MWWNLNYLGETSTMNFLSESDIIIIVAKEMLVSLATMVVFKVATLFLRNVVNEMAVSLATRNEELCRNGNLSRSCATAELPYDFHLYYFASFIARQRAIFSIET